MLTFVLAAIIISVVVGIVAHSKAKKPDWLNFSSGFFAGVLTFIILGFAIVGLSYTTHTHQTEQLSTNAEIVYEDNVKYYLDLNTNEFFRIQMPLWNPKAYRDILDDSELETLSQKLNSKLLEIEAEKENMQKTLTIIEGLK